MPTKSASAKPLYWVASSKRDLLDMPDGIQDVFGYALHLAQTGKKFGQAKPLKGFGSAGVLEVVEDWHGDAYRAVYTVKFASAVYVLHCFQKKSPSGIRTAQADIDLIHDRLKLAQQHYKDHHEI